MAVAFSTPERQHIVQNAYHVADLDIAINRFHRTLGIGPFFVRRHIGLDEAWYRGVATQLDISAAHVQVGSIQIELVTQHNSAPSAFRDMYPADQDGFHHIALFPLEHDTMVGHYTRLGFAVTTDLVTAERRGASYIDTRPLLGHMTEVYRVNDSLTAFYAEIADAARNWDGRNLRREM